MREFDIIVWATGFDFGTGALNRMGIRGRDGLALEDYWADGPKTFLGVQTPASRTSSSPVGRTPRPATTRGTTATRWTSSPTPSSISVSTATTTIEVDPEAEERWTAMVDAGAASSPFGESSYYFGTNIPGKPRKYLLNSGGRPKLFKEIRRVFDNDYKASNSPVRRSGRVTA